MLMTAFTLAVALESVPTSPTAPPPSYPPLSTPSPYGPPLPSSAPLDEVDWRFMPAIIAWIVSVGLSSAAGIAVLTAPFRSAQIVANP